MPAQFLGDSAAERRCHHGVLMVDYCPLRPGREAVGGGLIILSGLLVVLFGLLLLNSCMVV